MALTGTLEDFGIAEILQLVGQQAKSGVLHVKSGEEEIHVQIAEGCVISADHAGKQRSQRLGEMMVRAGALSQADLDHALRVQRRTLRRLGDLLLELGMVWSQDLEELVALQTSETVYRLFAFRQGTYAFEPCAVERSPSTCAPMAAEALLMEGFRRLDEWPEVRRVISSPEMTFARTSELGHGSDVGKNERRVLELVEPGRTVSHLVDLSRLGEFETCKALRTLSELGLLRSVAPARARGGESAPVWRWREQARRGASTALATVAMGAVLAIALFAARDRALRGVSPRDGALREYAVERYQARYELSVLRHALDVWWLERGEYPESLHLLVEGGLLSEADLLRPFGEPYHYRRAPGGYVLLSPLP